MAENIKYKIPFFKSLIAALNFYIHNHAELGQEAKLKADMDRYSNELKFLCELPELTSSRSRIINMQYQEGWAVIAERKPDFVQRMEADETIRALRAECVALRAVYLKKISPRLRRLELLALSSQVSDLKQLVKTGSFERSYETIRSGTISYYKKLISIFQMKGEIADITCQLAGRGSGKMSNREKIQLGVRAQELAATIDRLLVETNNFANPKNSTEEYEIVIQSVDKEEEAQAEASFSP